MTQSSFRTHLSCIILVTVLAILNVIQLLGMGFGGREARVRFVYLDGSGELREEDLAQIGETRFEVSLRADEVPGFGGQPLGDLRPYVKLVVRNRKSGGGRPEIDPTVVEVIDSEGHRFRVVGVWPGKGRASLKRIEYRYYLDAVEFNSRVKYQQYDRWQGMLKGQGWGPENRHTLRLRLPLRYRNEERVIEIDRLVCLPFGRDWHKRYETSLFRREPGLPRDVRE